MELPCWRAIVTRWTLERVVDSKRIIGDVWNLFSKISDEVERSGAPRNPGLHWHWNKDETSGYICQPCCQQQFEPLYLPWLMFLPCDMWCRAGVRYCDFLGRPPDYVVDLSVTWLAWSASFTGQSVKHPRQLHKHICEVCIKWRQDDIRRPCEQLHWRDEVQLMSTAAHWAVAGMGWSNGKYSCSIGWIADVVKDFLIHSFAYSIVQGLLSECAEVVDPAQRTMISCVGPGELLGFYGLIPWKKMTPTKLFLEVAAVDAAEATKPKDASITPLLIPMPPLLAGREAWSH